MRETWYVMEDGSTGDPSDIAPGKDGKLVHKDGRKVAYAPHGPRTRGVDADAERAKATAPKQKPAESHTGGSGPGKASKAAPVEAKDVKPEEPKGGYKTRETKAD
ncbi:MAG: hypothetical protein M9944_08005 [Rhizobiaceae bacterium]|nr:hypothetical protein [Rhizobiaceae bacterium]